jgi:WD40-like Beta Propeller Repeat
MMAQSPQPFAIEFMRQPWRRIVVGVLGAALCAQATADTLPSLWAAPAAKLDGTIKPPYAFVARPFFGERFNGVDVIALDPATMKPLSRSPTALRCDRVHATPSGELLCFTNSVPGKLGKFSNPTSYLYSRELTLTSEHANETNGRPSRARVSSDARFSATTEFTSGHSYIAVGADTFSTSTVIVQRGGNSERAEDIQNWPVLNAGQRITSVDLNLWGVTFHPVDTDRFFVTAYFDGKPYLAEGSVRARRIAVVKDSIECPSFSPDGKRLAFKKRTSATGWSPALLELAGMKETVFDVGNSVDDQIEWLDDHTLIYEVVRRPLVGQPSSDLVTLDLREQKPAQRVWVEQARSATFVRRQ